MEDEMKKNKYYKGTTRNCSTFAREGVRVSTGNENISGEESILFRKFVTPNQLYNDTKNLENVKTIVDAGNKSDYRIKDKIIFLIKQKK